MDRIFVEIWNMSVQTGIVICFILLARWVFGLCRVPKKYSYFLWLIPFVRFVSFVSVQSVFSLLPGKTGAFHETAVSWLKQSAQNPQMTSSFPVLNRIDLSSLAPTPQASADPLQILTGICGYIWVLVAVVLAVYSLGRLLLLKKKLRLSIRLRENIYLTDEINMPFVIGIIKPRIYLPSDLEERELEYVILHEQTHIRRHDMVIKAAAFLITLLHWFNPLAWAAFFCMANDMEMSCDEAVMRKLGQEREAEYAQTLLKLSVGRRRLQQITLAFGEGNTKGRVKNIIKYKKPLAITGAFALLATAALTLGLLTDPPGAENEPEQESMSVMSSGQDQMETTGEQSATFDTVAQIEIQTPEISPDMTLGADGVFLDYADNGIIIFHDYFGLFVYSIGAQGMTLLQPLPEGFIGAVDLKAIGCQDTQGDNFCEVRVSADGRRVYLHPQQESDMYVYDVYSQSLTRQSYSLEGIALFDDYVNREEMSGVVDSICSPQGILFSDGASPYYGYLISEDGTLGALAYVEYDMIVEFFRVTVSNENPVPLK